MCEWEQAKIEPSLSSVGLVARSHLSTTFLFCFVSFFYCYHRDAKMESLGRMTHLLFHLWQAALEIWLWVGSQEAVPVGRCSISLPESGQSQQHLRWVGHRRCYIATTALHKSASTSPEHGVFMSSTYRGNKIYRECRKFTVVLKRDGNASQLRAIVKSNGRSDFNQQHSVFEDIAMAPASIPSCGCREMCCRVCAQMGYASLDKCKSWQRADSKLHVPDGTQQKAQLHKSPLN